MKRRLISQGGGGGLTIYVPKKWLDSMELKAGDELEVSELDRGLLLSAQTLGKKEIVISLTDESKERIRGLITNAYKRGFDAITFQNTDEKDATYIKQILNDYIMGFEITETKKASVKIENISEPQGARYDVILRRAFLILKETMDIIENDLGKYDKTREVEDFRKQQDRYVNFCKRILYKERYDRNSIFEWDLLSTLSHLEHNLHYLFEYASKSKAKPDTDVRRVFHEFRDYFELFYQAYYEKQMKHVHKLTALKQEHHFGNLPKLLEKSHGSKTVILSYIREMFRLLQLGVSAIRHELLEMPEK